MDAECTSPIPDTSEFIVLYMHGGAYISGSARQYRGMHVRMARASRMRVLGFSYRLAPSYTFPVPLYDAYMAYKHVRHMGYADNQIVVAGDSAGGNLVLALWQLTRAPFRALILFSPRVDITSFRQSWKTYERVDVLHAYDIQDPVSPIHQLLVSTSKSLGNLDVLSDPFVAPIYADFKGLPPTLVQMGGAEVMGDDIREFTKRARMQGARIELQLERNHRTYVVRGANYWQAMNLGMADGPSSNRSRVLHDLQHLSSLGINTLRILAASEASQFGPAPDRIRPELTQAPGTYDERVLKGLDWVLAQLPHYNMTACISLGNFWTWSGGAAQYMSWATNSRIPYPVQWDHKRQVFEGGDYDVFLEYTAHFYNNRKAQKWYRSYIQHVIARTNSITNVPYRRDPTIMAWELMNEPQYIKGYETELEKWIDDSARLVRALAPMHLVTTGAESKNGARAFKLMHSSQFVTLASCHFWPLNWGYYNATDSSLHSVNASISKMQDFIQNNAEWARSLNKPTVLFEFGLMRDNWGEWGGPLDAYNPRAPVTHRDMFYRAVYKEVTNHLDSGLAGAAFWAYAGEARPPSEPTEVTWTGDPPHEPPGWNSIYNNDKSTLRIIQSFNSTL
ncbi:hypothetical protein GGH96_001656 [Coemansia sp. RSA 1972]|nr:hypothetical protein GGH96_001656 [Coemansia sp. RSA 1972]